MMEDGGWKSPLPRGYLSAHKQSRRECPRFRSSAAGDVKPPKATQSHLKATSKPYSRHILGIDSGVQSHPKATSKPTDSQPIGTPKPHQCDPKATPRLHQSHPKATPKPPQGYTKATPRLHQSHPKATPKPPQGYTKATPRLHQSHRKERRRPRRLKPSALPRAMHAFPTFPHVKPARTPALRDFVAGTPPPAHSAMKALASRQGGVAASGHCAAMNDLRKLLLPALLSFPLLCGAAALAAPDAAGGSAHAKALFKNPPREYSTGPLWVWNDMLTEQQIRDTMRDLASQKVKQVWVHPRPGLMTPYLSADWFRLWKVALKEAERLDMNVWIYDENSYPSGFAGGWVPELMPESRGRGLAFREAKAAPKWSDDIVGVYRLESSTSENVTAKVKAGETLPAGGHLLAPGGTAQEN